MTTVGVEEEYLLLDADTGLPAPRSARVRALACAREEVFAEEVGAELLQAQMEVVTPVCAGLEEVGRHLSRLRREVGAAAAEAGCRLAMSGAAPSAGPVPVPVTDEPRYQALSSATPRIIHEHVINGMHVHVAVPDRERGTAALNRTRPWLPVLLAMAANSPLAEGRDTGFASWRTLVYGRWPVSGPPPAFADGADYARRTAALVESGVIRDLGQLYWQARLSERYPTIEVRAMDVQLRADEAVLFTGLVRALVVTALGEMAAGLPAPQLPPELLGAAVWNAARFGLEGELLCPRRLKAVPAAEVVAALLDHVGEALVASGDVELVRDSVRRLLAEGTGACRQRRALRESGPDGLVDLLAGGSGSEVVADGGGRKVEDA